MWVATKGEQEQTVSKRQEGVQASSLGQAHVTHPQVVLQAQQVGMMVTGQEQEHIVAKRQEGHDPDQAVGQAQDRHCIAAKMAGRSERARAAWRGEQARGYFPKGYGQCFFFSNNNTRVLNPLVSGKTRVLKPRFWGAEGPPRKPGF